MQRTQRNAIQRIAAAAAAIALTLPSHSPGGERRLGEKLAFVRLASAFSAEARCIFMGYRELPLVLNAVTADTSVCLRAQVSAPSAQGCDVLRPGQRVAFADEADLPAAIR